jgi:hypothetical protein
MSAVVRASDINRDALESTAIEFVSTDGFTLKLAQPGLATGAENLNTK